MEIRVNSDPTFVRDGDDLHATLNMPMTAAALGTELSLDTFDGEQEIGVKAGTQSGRGRHPARPRRHRTCAATAAGT